MRPPLKPNQAACGVCDRPLRQLPFELGGVRCGMGVLVQVVVGVLVP